MAKREIVAFAQSAALVPIDTGRAVHHVRAAFVRTESLGDSRIDLLLIQRGGWRKEASLDDKAALARPS